LACLSIVVLGAPSTARAAPPTWRSIFVRPVPAAAPSVALCAVGDVMLGRHVGQVIRSRGADATLAALRELRGCDVLAGNLESPLTTRPITRRGPYRFTADPALAPALARAGFTVLSVANNHALDAGAGGLQDSVFALERAGLAAIGAHTTGRTDGAPSPAPRVVEVRGHRVAFFAFDDVIDPEDVREGSTDAKTTGTGGLDRARLDDAALAAISTLRTTEPSTSIVVMMHWGAEYVSTPSAAQTERARALVAVGADVVLGSHPHVLAPVTFVEVKGRAGLVAHSLGNFVFDAPNDPERAATRRSAVLRVVLNGRGVAETTFVPVKLEGVRPVFVPHESDDARTIEADLGVLSFESVEARALRDRRVTSAWRWALDPSSPAGARTLGALRDPRGALPPQRPRATTEPKPTRELRSTSLAHELDPLPRLDAKRASQLAERDAELFADLRGTGEAQRVTLRRGVVEVFEHRAPTSRVVWRNEGPTWRVLRISAGDADHDGRVELLLVLVKSTAEGRLTTHPFLFGWRGGRYRITWGGSATPRPIQDALLTDADGDGRDELVVLDGTTPPGHEGDTISVWTWHGWGFEQEWRATVPPSRTIGAPIIDGRPALVTLGR
ncbi:CapA family protein, partial [Myxococcota bacterium]|nr:CapA family protein [Myxococcota bacterium]